MVVCRKNIAQGIAIPGKGWTKLFILFKNDSFIVLKIVITDLSLQVDCVSYRTYIGRKTRMHEVKKPEPSTESQAGISKGKSLRDYVVLKRVVRSVWVIGSISELKHAEMNLHGKNSSLVVQSLWWDMFKDEAEDALSGKFEWIFYWSMWIEWIGHFCYVSF